jgi:hypothetical protein
MLKKFQAIWVKNKGDTSRQPIDAWTHARTDGNFFYPKNKSAQKYPLTKSGIKSEETKKFIKKILKYKIHPYFFKILPPCCFLA